jgi:hypothetical protein
MVWRFALLVEWWKEGPGWLRAVIALILAQVLLLILIAVRAGIKLYRQGQKHKARPPGTLDEDQLPPGAE